MQNTTFRPGDRVTSTVFGKLQTGVVTRLTQSGVAVFVRFDDSPRERWMFPESLTRVADADPYTPGRFKVGDATFRIYI